MPQSGRIELFPNKYKVAGWSHLTQKHSSLLLEHSDEDYLYKPNKFYSFHGFFRNKDGEFFIPQTIPTHVPLGHANSNVIYCLGKTATHKDRHIAIGTTEPASCREIAVCGMLDSQCFLESRCGAQEKIENEPIVVDKDGSIFYNTLRIATQASEYHVLGSSRYFSSMLNLLVGLPYLLIVRDIEPEICRLTSLKPAKLLYETSSEKPDMLPVFDLMSNIATLHPAVFVSMLGLFFRVAEQLCIRPRALYKDFCYIKYSKKDIAEQAQNSSRYMLALAKTSSSELVDVINNADVERASVIFRNIVDPLLCIFRHRFSYDFDIKNRYNNIKGLLENGLPWFVNKVCKKTENLYDFRLLKIIFGVSYTGLDTFYLNNKSSLNTEG